MNLPLILVVVLILAACPALGGDPSVSAVSGLVRHEITAAPSPTPGYCYWDSSPGATAFHATAADGYGNMDCIHPWMVHAGPDSLVFDGAYPAIASEFVLGAQYRVILEASLTFEQPTRVVAVRAVSGDLSQDEHSASLQEADGTVVPLLAAGSGPDGIELVVPAGAYVLRVQVLSSANAWADGLPGLGEYHGRVALIWEAAQDVGEDESAWDAVKAMYRH